ncbi:MAG: hypothetical protein V3576_07945 [Candidatus Cloacimonadota bacterium]
MAETLTISPANLKYIENGLQSLNENIRVVNGNVDVVNQHVDLVEGKLESLYTDFMLFLEADRKAKELQLAETRIVKVRQELDKRFGVHDEVRRHAVGILQAADLSMIRTETILTRAEEMMLNAPRYWLAPCLIALAAWLGDNRSLAEKAIAEAIKRDSEKSTLFFSLVCRRSGRLDACNQWLSRYLGLQDPTQLDREVIVLLDAFASGLLGPDTKGECSKAIMNWVSELSKQPRFIEDQKQKWEIALKSIVNKGNHSNYPLLKSYAQEWELIVNSLDAAGSHKVFKTHFSEIMETELVLDHSLAVEIDAILDKLSGEFDDEELPLRRDELRMTLIIEQGGDTKEADEKFAAQKEALAEKTSFTQLLTNAAMHPEVSNAGIATQKLAIALSLEWILMAFKDMTVRYQSLVPNSIHYNLVDWKGISSDGRNENDQVQSLTQKVENDKKEALAKIKPSIPLILLQAALILIGIKFWPLLIIGAIWLIISLNGLNTKKKQVIAQYDKLLQEAIGILKSLLAEIVDYRREFQTLDKEYKPTLDYLTAIEPQQYISNSFSKARSIL